MKHFKSGIIFKHLNKNQPNYINIQKCKTRALFKLSQIHKISKHPLKPFNKTMKSKTPSCSKFPKTKIQNSTKIKFFLITWLCSKTIQYSNYNPASSADYSRILTTNLIPTVTSRKWLSTKKLTKNGNAYANHATRKPNTFPPLRPYVHQHVHMAFQFQIGAIRFWWNRPANVTVAMYVILSHTIAFPPLNVISPINFNLNQKFNFKSSP